MFTWKWDWKDSFYVTLTVKDGSPFIAHFIAFVMSFVLSCMFAALIPMVIWNLFICESFSNYELPEITLTQGFAIFILTRYLGLTFKGK